MALQSIAIIGAGTMGGGIAITCMAAGLQTRVVDLSEAGLDALKLRATRYFDRQVEKQKITAEAAAAAMACLHVSTDIPQAAQADLVIEAVFEELEIKKKVFGELAPHLSPETLVATNTSALRLSDLADALPYPDTFLGLHYFSPAELNPIVELIAGPATESAHLDAAAAFLKVTGKTAVRCQDSNGFAINRFFCPYTNEAVRMLDEGVATTGQIDQIASDLFGLALGPFAMMNIIKPRINMNAVRNLSGLGAFYEPADGLLRIGAEGEMWPIEEVTALPEDASVAKIQARLRGATFLPILEAIQADVAAPADFDLGAREALRFGKPPVAMMQALGAEAVRSDIAAVLTDYAVEFPEEGLARVFR